MKALSIHLLALCLTITANLHAQENFVGGYIIDLEGKRIEGFIDDRYWTISPTTVQFKGDGLLKDLKPTDILEFGVNSGVRYRSILVTYDSSANLKDLSNQFNPEFKTEPKFLRVVLQSKVSLLELGESRAIHYFIEYGNKVEELINHEFYSVENGIKTKRVNRSFIEQLKRIMNDCKAINITNNSVYSEKALTRLFAQYNSCIKADSQVIYEKKKVLFKGGLVATVAMDQLRKGFDGGVGYGAGLFFNVLFPHKLYKVSLYNELTYRKFGDQSIEKFNPQSGYTIFETYSVNSIKTTSLIRNKVGQNGRVVIGAGVTYAFGLKDEFEHREGVFNWVSTDAKSNGGFVLSLATEITSGLLLELRYERGGAINFKDSQYLTASTGHSSAGMSVVYQF